MTCLGDMDEGPEAWEPAMAGGSRWGQGFPQSGVQLVCVCPAVAPACLALEQPTSLKSVDPSLRSVNGR